MVRSLLFLTLALLSSSVRAEDMMQLSSPSFVCSSKIPEPYTCHEGDGVSPPLQWEGAPAGTRSFALVVDDPDAPGRVFVHWVVYNLPASLRGLPEAVARGVEIPGGGLQGINDFGWPGYGGACPPRGHGVHRYRFTLYALDTMLRFAPGPVRRGDLDRMMDGHVLAQAGLVGLYSRD